MVPSPKAYDRSGWVTRSAPLLESWGLLISAFWDNYSADTLGEAILTSHAGSRNSRFLVTPEQPLQHAGVLPALNLKTPGLGERQRGGEEAESATWA